MEGKKEEYKVTIKIFFCLFLIQIVIMWFFDDWQNILGAALTCLVISLIFKLVSIHKLHKEPKIKNIDQDELPTGALPIDHENFLTMDRGITMNDYPTQKLPRIEDK